MARVTDPKCRQCRREGVKLFLKGERCLTEKCAVERRSYPPGQHGRGRIKQSEYLLQLRGDGRVGEDVTRNIETIEELPKRIEGAPPVIEVRGEVYLPIPAFAELNRRRSEAGLPAFANPRNSAAGSIRFHVPPTLTLRRITCRRGASGWSSRSAARPG